MAALKAKVVHAGTLSPPSSFVAHKAGFKILFDMSRLGVDYVASGLGIKKSYLASNRAEAKQFVMAMIEGAKILTTDEEFSLKVPYPSVRAIKDTLDALAKDLSKAKDADPRDFIDNSIVKEIEASGFIETVYGK